MKTVPFSDILAEVCQLIGLDTFTLNAQSFGAIRDFTSRRIGTIWDREEWPDTNRFLRTFPGNPIQSAQLLDLPTLTIEYGDALTTENNIDLWVQTSANTQELELTLDHDFPRVYVEDFADDAYRLGTIASTAISFENPFYYNFNGQLESVADIKSMSRYNAVPDEIGNYIYNFVILVPYGSVVNFPTYQGPNGKLTTTVVFEKNPKRIVELQTGSLQGLAAWNVDPRITTRSVPVDFMVEDLTNPQKNEVTYLNFLQNGEKFIQYRLNAPRLFGSLFFPVEFPMTQYSSGAQVYYNPLQGTQSYNNNFETTKGSRGDFWNCITDFTNYQRPSYSSTVWEQVEIPYRFKDYLVNGVGADFLRSEGRADEATALDQLAEMAVQQQIDVLIRQQGQNQKLNMAYTY
jgi:hypothetical protein